MDNEGTPIKFDTIKLTTKSKFISNINAALFSHDIDVSTGELLSIEYRSSQHADITPFELHIRTNYKSHRLSIEFSSKILLADYPRLISIQTFRQCLKNIESLGICTFDIDGVIQDCYFNKLHITKDIDLKLTPEILDRLNHCTGDYRRYKWHRYKDSIQFTRNVKAADCRESLTLYDKGVEILLHKNRDFLKKTYASESIINYFHGKTRLEVKLENKRKIQKELEIVDTDYNSVMNCRKSIVLAQFDKIFGSNPPVANGVKINNIVDYGLWNIIRYHNFNLQSIEQEIKDIRLYKEKTKGAMGKQMKKIKAMIDAYLNENHKANSIISNLRKLLE